MRQRCVPQRDTLAHKQLTFRPPDPPWAPTAAVARARKALNDYDPFLALWWSPVVRMFDSTHPGRWTVKSWMPHSGSWETVFIWEGPNKEYRDEFPIDQLLQEVAKRDLNQMGKTLQEWSDDLDKQNEGMEYRRDRGVYHEAMKHAVDKALYDSDIKKGVTVTDHRSARTRHSARKVIARERHSLPR